MIVLVIVYFLCLVVLIFHRSGLHFTELLLKRKDLCQSMSEMWPSSVLNFLYSCQNHFHIRQEFLNIVFCKLACCIYMQFLNIVFCKLACCIYMQFLFLNWLVVFTRISEYCVL